MFYVFHLFDPFLILNKFLDLELENPIYNIIFKRNSFHRYVIHKKKTTKISK